MTPLRIVLIGVAVLSIRAAAAWAQTSDPERSMVAIARGVGSTNARDSELGGGFQVSGTIGRTLTPRIAVELEVGGGNFAVTNPSARHNLNVLFASANVHRKWVWRRWQPFVIAGIGIYRYSEKPGSMPRGSLRGRDISVGASVGGGFEYFVSSDTAITLHSRYHAVPEIVTVRRLRGSFSVMSLGFRQYF